LSNCFLKFSVLPFFVVLFLFSFFFLHAIKRAGVRNPVILLDEIDKAGRSNFKGDVTAALLEVLDPEQNHAFMDHYLNVPYDLADCVFICTANRLEDIPRTLIDRLEIIRVSGYSPFEKVQIAQKHLLPKQLIMHGLEPTNILLPANVITSIVSRYTREAGVRDLERRVAAVCRHAALSLQQHRQSMASALPASTGQQQAIGTGMKPTSGFCLQVTEAMLPTILGPPTHRDIARDRLQQPGTALGLVWTEAGGDVMCVEATLMEGKGRLTLTGQLGDVIKESAQIAASWVRSHFPSPPAVEYLLHSTSSNVFSSSTPRALLAPNDPMTSFSAPSSTNPFPIRFAGTHTHILADAPTPSPSPLAAWFDRVDVHIHFPEGAVPKDGPSAGITLVCVLASLLSRQPVRPDTAMTGEQ
jgi:ATP-dependent Lon protease